MAKFNTPLTREVAEAALNRAYDWEYAMHQRFGQAICNALPLDFHPWPELFHESDPEKALDILLNEVGDDDDTISN